MATYKGNDIAPPDQLDSDIKLTLAPRPGLENIEEDLKLPPSAELDHMRKPGEKNYMENQQMADKDGPRPVVRKIPEGVSGIGKDYPSPEPTNTVGSVGGKPMGGYSEYGSTMGGTWKRPSNYNQGGMVKHGSSTHVACQSKHRG
jgi:hypothetical protein